MPNDLKTFKILTLGCKANQYDSQLIREQLNAAGLKELSNGRRADCYIINTCTVTARADSQSRNYIRSAHRENPKARVAVTGCYAQVNADTINGIEGVSFIINNDEKSSIVDRLLSRPPKYASYQNLAISDFAGHARAFVKVQDGCDNFCSFCKVPYARGRSHSRSIGEITDEIGRLARTGYKEVVLTGICLGDYGNKMQPRCDIVDLINDVEKVNGIERIRLSSIEARDISEGLIEKIKFSNKLCVHLHIPFQSGDDGILKAMNRRDTYASYIKLVARLKDALPAIGISADIMVGFPGEGEAAFRNTLRLVEEVAPMRVHIFPFSPRDGTPLAHSNQRLNPHLIKQRSLRLKELSEKVSERFKKRFIHQALDVLFEEKKNGFWQGYSSNYLLVCVKDEGCDMTNVLVPVKVNGISSIQLRGEILSKAGHQKEKKL